MLLGTSNQLVEPRSFTRPASDSQESHLRDLNSRPELYESSALPTELRWHMDQDQKASSQGTKYLRVYAGCPPE